MTLSSAFSTSLISANFVFFVESFFDMFFLFKSKNFFFLLIFFDFAIVFCIKKSDFCLFLYKSP